MRTRIVRRFLWSAFLLFAISLLGVDLYVTNVTSRNEIEDLRAALEVQARILAAELPAIGSTQFDTWVKNWPCLESNARLRLPRAPPNGNPLGNSGFLRPAWNHRFRLPGAGEGPRRDHGGHHGHR